MPDRDMPDPARSRDYDPPDNPDTSDLWDLVDRAQDGCMTAYGELYNLTVDQVRAFLLNMVRHTQLAEDLTADTYVRILSRIRRATAPFTRRSASPVSLLIRVAENLALDHYRRSHTRLSVPMADIGEALTAAARADRAAHITPAAREEALVLWKGINALPEDQRAVLLLRFLLGHDTRDTAAQLHRSVQAVRQLQGRAVKAIRQDDGVRELSAN